MSDEVNKRLDGIWEIVERIDSRTDWHSTSLENIGVNMKALQAASVEQSRHIAANTERIADSIDRIANKALDAATRRKDPTIIVAILFCVGVITGLLILAYTGKDFSATHKGSNLSVGGLLEPEKKTN